MKTLSHWHSDTVKAMKSFSAAASKVNKLILKVAAGSKDDEMSLIDSINKLYSRRNKAEIRGVEDAAAMADGVLAGLQSRIGPAMETGNFTRQAKREIIDKTLVSESTGFGGDAATRQYMKELELMRGRR